MTKDYKLYRSGRFFDLKKDPFEEGTPQQIADLTGREAAVAKELQAVLARYADARPEELRKTAAEAGPKKSGRKAARKQRRQAKAASEE
jgi:hypothetical protein